MAKRIQISADDTTYYTLPGNSGELSNEAGELEDTIFGQEFQSNESGLISWNVQANALYKGFAGYICSIKKTGVATIMTGEAASLVSGKIYQITAATKQILDPATAVVVKVGGVDQTANVIRIDYLQGIVEFASGYTVSGSVTIDAKYLPTSEIAGTKSWTLTQTMEPIDVTDIPTARANDGHQVMGPEGLKTVGLELTGIYKSSNAFRAALLARNPVVIEINPDNSGKSVARGFFKFATQSQSGDVGALEEETLNLNLWVPDITLADKPFRWIHSNLTTLNAGVKALLDAWINSDTVFVKYLPDGTNGVKGEAVVAEISLSGGLEVMNEFTVNLQSAGALTAVP